MFEKTFNLWLFLCISLLAFYSCSTSKLISVDELFPGQKLATYSITNQDFHKTNQEILSAVEKYMGFIKYSFYNEDYNTDTNGYWEIAVPQEFFEPFNNQFIEKFKTQIVSQYSAFDQEISNLFKYVNENIELNKNKIENLNEIYQSTKNLNERILIETEINKLSNEVQILNQKRKFLIESFKYGIIKVIWISTSKYNDFKSHSIAGLPPPPKRLIFSQFGQTESFNLGEPISIEIEDIDSDSLAFLVWADLDKKNVKLKLLSPSDSEVILLEDKCQIVLVTNNTIPKIIKGDAIKNEQIVITPILDDNCNVIGQEIRAGTIQSGCFEGRKNYYRLLNCLKFGTPSLKRKTKSAQKQEQPKIIQKKGKFDYKKELFMLPWD